MKRSTKTGDLRDRVTIQELTEVTGRGGGRTRSFTLIGTVPTVWAGVKPVAGQERDDAGRKASLQTYLVTLRYRGDITTKHRLIWNRSAKSGGDVTLNISSVSNRDGRRIWLTIEASAGDQPQ